MFSIPFDLNLETVVFPFLYIDNQRHTNVKSAQPAWTSIGSWLRHHCKQVTMFWPWKYHVWETTKTWVFSLLTLYQCKMQGERATCLFREKSDSGSPTTETAVKFKEWGSDFILFILDIPQYSYHIDLWILHWLSENLQSKIDVSKRLSKIHQSVICDY